MADKQTTRVARDEKHNNEDRLEELLTLDIVKDLGGNQKDLMLVKDIEDEEEEFETPDGDLDTEPVKRNEIKDFLAKLEIRKYRPKDEKKVKPKKLLSMPLKDETAVEEPAISQTETKGKKGKNKFKIQHSEVSSTTSQETDTSNLTSHVEAYRSRNSILLQSGSNWRDDESLPLDGTIENTTIMKQMEAFAVKLLEDEVAVYTKQREKRKKSEAMWMKTVLTSGTLKDKMAALTLLVQESPVHNLSSLRSLVAMVKKKGKRECLMAADALKELFISTLLPDRKLRAFTQNNCHKLHGNADAIDRHLLQWYTESQIKGEYEVYIQALEVLCHDNLLATKQQTLSILHQLLASKPEREKKILEILVNKVGDPDYKLASKASYFLTRLVEQHPNMKTVIVDELERLLYRPNVSSQAQYYCVCFLNQILLSRKDQVLATRLVLIYISFFKLFVKQKEVETKMMSALLTGVNRAFPYAKGDEAKLYEQLDTLYRIVHIVNFNTSIQALMLLYQVMDSSQSQSDRYYSALYKKMSDPALKNSAKQTMFLNLLFRSVKKDESEKRIKAFVKRLLQLCSQQPPNFICGTLLLLSEVLKSKSGVLSLNHKAEESDEEENFVDLPDPDDEASDKNYDTKTVSKSSWIHRQNLGGHIPTVEYNPAHRNPQYCGAEYECIWELEKLANHFHPSVSLFAKTILQGKKIEYSGDPLHDFTLIRFLERFVFKNPKTGDKVHEATATLSKAKCHQSTRDRKQIAVNTEKFLGLSEDQVVAEDKFLHKYFTQKDAKKKEKKGGIVDVDSDAESVNDNEFDDYLDTFEKQLDGGREDLGNLDMDFAGLFGKKKDKSDKNRVKGSDSDEDFGDLTDEEVDFGNDENFAAAFEDDLKEDGELDEEDISFSDDELSSVQNGKRKKLKGVDEGMPVNKRNKSSVGLFAAAEEFADLIDETAGAKSDMTSLNALSNKDSADVKQLKWEMDRDNWLKDKGNKKRNKNISSRGSKKLHRNIFRDTKITHKHIHKPKMKTGIKSGKRKK